MTRYKELKLPNAPKKSKYTRVNKFGMLRLSMWIVGVFGIATLWAGFCVDDIMVPLTITLGTTIFMAGIIIQSLKDEKALDKCDEREQ